MQGLRCPCRRRQESRPPRSRRLHFQREERPNPCLQAHRGTAHQRIFDRRINNHLFRPMVTLIYLIVSIISILILIGYLLLRSKLRDYNQSPLDIKTFDGSDSPYHPSVKYKKEGYAGYEYIMAETPFYLTLPSRGKNYRDQFECPSIHFSHDGLHWEEIIQNPIDNLTQNEIDNRDYFSDPDLVETPEGLECWYRLNRRYGKETNQENIILLRKKSKDGVNWGEREIIADLQKAHPEKGLGRIVISQTLLYEGGKYKCWYVDDIHLGKEKVVYSESADGLCNWSDKKEVKLNGLKITPWHIHILRDKETLWLVVYDHRKITLWKSTIEIEFQFVKTLVEPCGVYGSFYSNNTYRACLTKVSDDLYRLYFSADDLFHSYIGVMEGSTPETMAIVSIDNEKHSTVSNAVYLFLKTIYYKYSRKIAYYTKRLYQKPIELLSSN